MQHGHSLAVTADVRCCGQQDLRGDNMGMRAWGGGGGGGGGGVFAVALVRHVGVRALAASKPNYVPVRCVHALFDLELERVFVQACACTSACTGAGSCGDSVTVTRML